MFNARERFDSFDLTTGMSIYFRTVSRWRVTMSRRISPMSWWVRHAECDKFIPCRNSKPHRTVLYQFPCLTGSMTSECVFVIYDMRVWYITFYEWVKRSHNNTNCMILYIQTGLTPSTRHGIVFVVRYGWWLASQTDMSVSSDNLVGFFQSIRVFFQPGRGSGYIIYFLDVHVHFYEWI